MEIREKIRQLNEFTKQAAKFKRENKLGTLDSVLVFNIRKAYEDLVTDFEYIKTFRYIVQLSYPEDTMYLFGTIPKKFGIETIRNDILLKGCKIEKCLNEDIILIVDGIEFTLVSTSNSKLFDFIKEHKLNYSMKYYSQSHLEQSLRRYQRSIDNIKVIIEMTKYISTL